MASGVFPALALAPATGGLLSAASVTNHREASSQWMGGAFSWDTYACPTELIVTDHCVGSQSGPIAESQGDPGEGWPLGIISRQQCASLGYSVDERNDMVRAQIEVATGKALERELQTGEAALSGGHDLVHFLADGDAVTVTSSASPVLLAVAALEQALADCGVGAQGVIHMPRAAATLLGNKIQQGDSDKLFTTLGTPIVAGTGYLANKAPAAGTPDVPPTKVDPSPLPSSGWIYATGPVAVHLGPIQILDEQLDRENNVITVTAARPAAVYFDSCCHFASEIKYG